MKKLTIIIFALIFSTAFFACKKKDDPTPTAPAVASIMAKIGGTQYNSSTVVHSNYSGVDLFSSMTSSKALGISTNVLTKGTHPFSGNDVTVVYTADNGAAPYTSNFGNTGTIIITANSGTTISGTFTCHLYNIFNTADSVVITNGTFTNLNYK